jgi:hypothetical protein
MLGLETIKNEISTILMNKDCFITADGFVIVPDERSVEEVVIKVNQKFPRENPWTFDQIVELANETGDWGFADEYSFCINCGNVFSYYPNYYPEYWYDPEHGEEICAKCVEEFAEDYISFLVENPSEKNWFLSEEVLERLGFRRLAESIPACKQMQYYQDFRKVFDKNYQIIFHISYLSSCLEAWIRRGED